MPGMGSSSTHYGTTSEIRFLNKLGTHSQLNKNPRDLLRKYMETAQRRSDWAEMDKDLVLAHCWRMIGDE